MFCFDTDYNYSCSLCQKKGFCQKRHHFLQNLNYNCKQIEMEKAVVLDVRMLEVRGNFRQRFLPSNIVVISLVNFHASVALASCVCAASGIVM